MIEFKPSHPENAPYLIVVIPLGIIVFLHPEINEFSAVEIIALQLPLESYAGLPSSTMTEESDLQLIRIFLPIDFTLLGIIIVARLLQPQNILSVDYQ